MVIAGIVMNSMLVLASVQRNCHLTIRARKVSDWTNYTVNDNYVSSTMTSVIGPIHLASLVALRRTNCYITSMPVPAKFVVSNKFVFSVVTIVGA